MHTLFNVYVPSPESNLLALGIAGRSAIVASPQQRDPQNPVVYYEGNLLGASNLNRFVERLLHAAGRASVRYPTTAMMAVPRDQLTRVGTYDLEAQALEVSDRPALLAGLDGEGLA